MGVTVLSVTRVVVSVDRWKWKNFLGGNEGEDGRQDGCNNGRWRGVSNF